MQFKRSFKVFIPQQTDVYMMDGLTLVCESVYRAQNAVKMAAVTQRG